MNEKYIKDLVSVIVPVYNVENYLAKCITSLCKQTYSNLEILFINDGSTDNSFSILENAKQKDDRIKIFTQNNGGLSAARNRGIDEAIGEYICFVDSDDWVSEEYLTCMLNAIKKYDADIAICNIQYIFDTGKIKKRTPSIVNEKCVDKMEALRDLFNSNGFRFHAVNKLFRHELFNTDIRFPIGKIYEDMATIYKLFGNSDKIAYVPKIGYYYLQNRSGSILTSSFNDNRLHVFEIFKEIKQYIDEKEYPLKEQYQHLVITNEISLMNYIYPVYNRFSPEQAQKIINQFKDSRQKYELEGYIKNLNISIIEKIRFFLICNNTCFYISFMQFCKGGRK